MSANDIRKEGSFVRVEGPSSNVVWLNLLDAREAVRLLDVAAPPSEAPDTDPTTGWPRCKDCGVFHRPEDGECTLARLDREIREGVAAARPEAGIPEGAAWLAPDGLKTRRDGQWVAACTACACPQCQDDRIWVRTQRYAPYPKVTR